MFIRVDLATEVKCNYIMLYTCISIILYTVSSMSILCLWDICTANFLLGRNSDSWSI